MPSLEKIKKSNDDFINKAKKIHGDKFDYSNSEYKYCHEKVKILCREHKEFLQTPTNHLNGAGCPVCSGNDKLSLTSFISKANKVHNNIYDYSLIEYIHGNKSKVKIICKKHDIFEKSVNKHLIGQGCPACTLKSRALKLTKTNEKFIEDAIKIHADRFDYSLVNYINSATKVKIICKNHGTFIQNPPVHLGGSSCSACSSSISKMGTEWLNSLKISTLIHEHPISENKRRKVDGYDPITNTIYQFHGRYYHSDPRVYSSDSEFELRNITHGENYNNSVIRDFQLLCWGYNLVVMWEYDYREKFNINQIINTGNN